MKRTYGLNVKCRCFFKEILNLCTIFSYYIEVISSGFTSPSLIIL